MNQNNVKPLGDRVLIKRSKVTTSKGGILLPDSAQDKPKEGVIVAVGPGKQTENGTESLSVNIGDHVMFSSYSGTEVESNNNTEEELIIMSETDILGVLV